jgi:hypothetical protein
MKISRDIDLSRSLRHVFGNKADFNEQILHDCARQSDTASAILHRFFVERERERRELMILADEVGLGKTFVALAVAVSVLDAIRRGESPNGLPANKPVILVITPKSDALFNKWLREVETFRKDCARNHGDLDWLQIITPDRNNGNSSNIIDLSSKIRAATRARPMLIVAKQSVFGAALHDRDWWRLRSLAAVFGHFRTPTDVRRYWCRKGRVFDNFGIPELHALLDLRSSGYLWVDGVDGISPDLARAFARALDSNQHLSERLAEALNGNDEDTLSRFLDDLTRYALVSDWPQFPLVILDEIHGLKNEHVQSRRSFEAFAAGKVCRLLGLSATPFQLRHDELLSLLKLRNVLSLSKSRAEQLDEAVDQLGVAIKSARDAGESFRRRWKALRQIDQGVISQTWDLVMKEGEQNRQALAAQIRPPRISHAIIAALNLEHSNRELRRHLQPFIIRHQHLRGYREHFVGHKADAMGSHGSLSFSWSPGMEVHGHDELAQYLMMRAVALSKQERGLPNLGAELTGSYRHLVETAAVWKKLAKSTNPLLRDYHDVLKQMIGTRTEERDPDAEHRKIQATVHRALEFFKRGQKSLVFCVYTKTAESVRDHLQVAIEKYLSETRQSVFGDSSAFENLRRRFFNRRELLFSLIQDHPLLGQQPGGRIGVPSKIALNAEHLEQVSLLLVKKGEHANSDKPDRRLIIAATEQIAVAWWRETADGKNWLQKVLQNCPDLEERIVSANWLVAREPLSRSERAGRATRHSDPEAQQQTGDPLEVEDAEAYEAPTEVAEPMRAAVDAWTRRLREDAIGEILAPYFQQGLIAACHGRPPLLVQNHGPLMAQFGLETRAVAGQVFRRILMADEFLLRYLADLEKDNNERWADYLSERYVKPLDGHLESLRDRVNAYLETLVRALSNNALLAGYYAGAENRNVVQLVKGETKNRDRYFLGFNTPYRPEILISTSVGQEGIDLHRECRHIIHHDLCWNPATIEQRTGRVDRIGSKVERERMGVEEGTGPTLEIAVPYLAATYDERMFEELYRRAQLFEVTLGGDIRVDSRMDPDQVPAERKRREKLGIGTDDEDLGDESNDSGVVDLPADMIARLRVDLSVWKPNMGPVL